MTYVQWLEQKSKDMDPSTIFQSINRVPELEDGQPVCLDSTDMLNVVINAFHNQAYREYLYEMDVLNLVDSTKLQEHIDGIREHEELNSLITHWAFKFFEENM